MELKIVLASDTHSLHRKMKYPIPECDLFIHAGDYTNIGAKHDVVDFYKWLEEQKQCTNIVFIGGNHDRHEESRFDWETGANEWFQDVLEEYKINTEESNIYRLENSSIELYGLNIYGSPMTPSFYRDHWAHNADRGKEIKKYWDEIPNNTDIVITHGPPIYKMDKAPSGGYVGCADLDYRIQEVKPLLHVFGHIHEGYGLEETIDTIYANASICNPRYQPINEPHTITFNI